MLVIDHYDNNVVNSDSIPEKLYELIALIKANISCLNKIPCACNFIYINDEILVSLGYDSFEVENFKETIQVISHETNVNVYAILYSKGRGPHTDEVDYDVYIEMCPPSTQPDAIVELMENNSRKLVNISAEELTIPLMPEYALTALETIHETIQDLDFSDLDAMSEIDALEAAFHLLEDEYNKGNLIFNADEEKLLQVDDYSCSSYTKKSVNGEILEVSVTYTWKVTDLGFGITVLDDLALAIENANKANPMAIDDYDLLDYDLLDEDDDDYYNRPLTIDDYELYDEDDEDDDPNRPLTIDDYELYDEDDEDDDDYDTDYHSRPPPG